MDDVSVQSHSVPTEAIEDVTLHAQELDLNELDNFDAKVPEDVVDGQTIPDAEVDLDDILPSESFSRQGSPATSQVDGTIPHKPPISIFQKHSSTPEQHSIPENSIKAGPSAADETPKPIHDPKKDDIPTRCSDIEDSPPLEAAGFFGDEIPAIDSDGEWEPIPESSELAAKQLLSQIAQSGIEPTEIDGPSVGIGEKKRKKKKKRKSKHVRGAKALESEKNRNPAELITGFEEFYAEPPMRVDQLHEEEALYDPKLSVAARAERVVQRYRAARRFNIDRERIFSSYLTFGGIRTGPKQFQGFDPKMEGTAEDFAAAVAKDAVDEEEDPREVDFEWVLRGFLAYHFPINHGWKSDQDVMLGCDLLTNFLTYIEFHNVFPEYEDNITSAKALLVKAKHELITNRKCCNALPGDFNRACSTYFGGHYQDLYEGSSDEEYESRFTCRKAMKFLRQTRGQKFLAERHVEEWSFPCEVVAITAEEMVLKQWIPPGVEDDYVEPVMKDEEIPIFLEPEVLEHVYLAMHIEGTWHKLSSGRWYMDQITAVLPSFYMEVPEEEYPDEIPKIV